MFYHPSNHVKRKGGEKQDHIVSTELFANKPHHGATFTWPLNIEENIPRDSIGVWKRAKNWLMFFCGTWNINTKNRRKATTPWSNMISRYKKFIHNSLWLLQSSYSGHWGSTWHRSNLGGVQDPETLEVCMSPYSSAPLPKLSEVCGCVCLAFIAQERTDENPGLGMNWIHKSSQDQQQMICAWGGHTYWDQMMMSDGDDVPHFSITLYPGTIKESEYVLVSLNSLP